MKNVAQRYLGKEPNKNLSGIGRPEYPTVTKRKIIQTKDKQRNFRAVTHITSNRHS
jgi:hypothetical protein